MRPPMQKSTLQQNEANRLHHHIQQQQQQQHQQQHQQQQQQLQQQQPKHYQTAFVASPHNHIRKSKLEQRELLVENQLLNACSTVIQTIPTTIQTTQSDAALRQQHPIEFYRRPKTHVINEFEDSEQQTNAEISTLDVNETSVQLVDLSTSPPHETLTFTNQPDVLRRIPNSSASPPSTQRSSLFSQYSRSSSSDDCSLSISTSGGGGNYISHSNNFDDGAENFVINFPADTASLPSYKKNDCIINLPLSETEPLLTNIEATVNDSERSIYLHKNSSSLVFTKKELPNTLTSSTSSLANNNLRRTSLATITVNNKSSAFPLAQLRRNHSSLRSSSEENHKRKPTKHLPASYQQLQRRSLQLNYNNNLITTSTCSVHHNNNQCCGGNTASNSAVLHKLQQSNRTKPHTTNVKLSSDAVGTITSAGASRRQYSYSWYAPVYSALEEELEQDSRDSSPIHNLANPKKKQINNYHQQKTLTTTVSDNDTEVLLETHNHINIQAQLPTANSKRSSGSLQAPAKLTLPLQHSLNSTFKGRQPRTESIGSVERGEFGSVPKLGSYETEGPQAGSLGLAGGPQPRRIRFGNFLKSLVGLRPSVNNVLVQNAESYNAANTANAASNGSVAVKTMPSSPEITITRTPSEQNMVVLRNPSASHSSREKLANGGSSTSLNVMQQKLWNMMKRDGSSNSLNHEKSQSIVQYTNLRKCETVLALTRQANSLCSPTLEVSSSSSGYHLNESNHHAPYTGSGIFSANGVEQIRPLNRLRNSTVSINATCSRCSSLLSMAASGSRYSLNATPGSIPHLRNPSILSSSNLSSNYSRNGDNNLENLSIANKSNSRINFCAGRKTFDSGANNVINSRTSSVTSPTTTITTTASTTKLTSPPTDQTLAVSSLTASPREVALATATLLGLAKPTTTIEQTIVTSAISDDVVDGVSNNNAGNIASAYASLTSLHASFHSDSSSVLASVAKSNAIANVTLSTSPDETATVESATAIMTSSSLSPSLSSSAAGFQNSSTIKARPFEIFTCKLCLVDVENASDSTILQQCGCQFCTECMRAYVEFEISEGAYEISCPDSQCPAQGVMTLPEIAHLTTSNLMKKHHRYRLNREIELDKTRTWCPRAGCETVCLIGTNHQQQQQQQQQQHSDSLPSTSNAPNTSVSSSFGIVSNELNGKNSDTLSATTPLLCAVQCPSCKDEFCSACKKAWHPNITCEEHSRRLVADGQDDIGIPFDNDLIKCCPMCAVPIEKDEGCAQMMCKRCKHVFCWYCLASLDDDFLLRHYDKGPCKNKLGHSRASVVWHRAQVIGIFAGFGILLLVASPLLLLAAPCIICCKCRSCSGSKIDEGDGEMDEATALQSLN